MRVLMCRMRHLAQVKLREQNKHKRLDQGHKDAQPHQGKRYKPLRKRWGQVRYRLQHLLVRKQVSEKTNTKREGTNEITDQLDRKDQRRDPPDGASEVFQVSEETVLTDADVVVVKKRTQPECERDTRRRRGTHEQRKQSHQI